MTNSVSSKLPSVITTSDPDRVVSILDEASLRGRLAGFQRGEKELGGVLFKTCAFATPFDGELLARSENIAGETRLHFQARLKPLLPWIFVIITVVSIWPGYPFTRDLLRLTFPQAGWLWGTAAYWYLPLAIIGGPWSMWVAWKRSIKELRVSAVEMVAKVAKEIGGRVEG